MCSHNIAARIASNGLHLASAESSMGAWERTVEHRTDELISELRDRVRSLENQLRQERAANKENRRILAARTSRAPELPVAPEPGSTQPPRRRLRSWWRWWAY